VEITNWDFLISIIWENGNKLEIMEIKKNSEKNPEKNNVKNITIYADKLFFQITIFISKQKMEINWK
jgi:hypothetical protein